MTSCDTVTESESDLGSSMGGRVSDADLYEDLFLASTSKPPTEADVISVRPVPPVTRIVTLDCRP